jgi:hypothetical protein
MSGGQSVSTYTSGCPTVNIPCLHMYGYTVITFKLWISSPCLVLYHVLVASVLPPYRAFRMLMRDFFT